MTSFFAMEYYSPVAVLLLGITTFIGIAGVGLLLLHLLGLQISSPWRQVVGVLLGIQVLSLAIQIVGMMGIATRPVLIGIWLMLVAVGGVSSLKFAYPLKPISYKVPHSWGLLPLIMGMVALTVNLLVAIAPSTKIDELHYHMLLPSRIVTDGALHFYREPLEGAILPHMIFQISATPLHALGFPDAANVVSWGLSLTLVWFGWYLISDRIEISACTYLCITPIVVGIYPVVWHVTGGAHAMGDLATAAAAVVLFMREDLLKRIPLKAYASISSILVLSSVSSKVSLLPLGMVIICLTTGSLLRHLNNWREICKIAMVILLPWLIFYLPIIIWTYWQSGSPFGPLLSTVFPDSIYHTEYLNKNYFSKVRSHMNVKNLETIKNTLVGYSPIIWIISLGVATIKEIKIFTRLLMVGLLLTQILIIYFCLTPEARYLGGIQYGLVILFGINIPNELQYLAGKKSWLVSILLILPWLSIQTYYAAQFFPVSLALENKVEFYDKYIAFDRDYKKLNDILPKKAGIIIEGVIINSVYSPRPVYINIADAPINKKLFLFQINLRANFIKPETVDNYKIGKAVYINPQAVVQTYRVPGKSPDIGRLQVFEMTRQ